MQPGEKSFGIHASNLHACVVHFYANLAVYELDEGCSEHHRPGPPSASSGGVPTKEGDNTGFLIVGCHLVLFGTTLSTI